MTKWLLSMIGTYWLQIYNKNKYRPRKKEEKMQKMEYKSVEGTVFCVSVFTIEMCKEG